MESNIGEGGEDAGAGTGTGTGGVNARVASRSSVRRGSAGTGKSGSIGGSGSGRTSMHAWESQSTDGMSVESSWVSLRPGGMGAE